MTIRDILEKLGVRGVERKRGITPAETPAAISYLFDADAARQQSDSLRDRPGIATNAAELGKER